MIRRTAALLAALAGALGLVVVAAGPASAHPLGNFTVNTASRLVVTPERLTVQHVVDMAEIPTYQARARIDGDADGDVSAAESSGWARQECGRRADTLVVTVAGGRATLRVGDTAITFPAGVGGLPTLRLTCTLTAELHGSRTVLFRDGTDDARVGWHEVSAVGDRARLVASDVPAVSPSALLTAYPKDRLTSPLDVRSARLRFEPGGAALAADRGAAAAPGAASGVDRATRAFAALIGEREPTVGFLLLALLAALALGGLHALAPGHGKTIMAGYLMGARGRLRDALTVAATVTLTHTAGVLVLGVVVTAAYATAPERVYPWLGLGSGVLAAWVGAALLRTTLRGRRVRELVGAHVHPHPHPHPHAHPQGHHHDHDHHHEAAPLPSRRSLVALGLAGGMLPSPSAVVVLLAGVALHRTWLAVLLVVAYGAGMALVLAGAGLLVVRAQGLVDRVATGRRSAAVARLAPYAAASTVLVAGLLLVARSTSALV